MLLWISPFFEFCIFSKWNKYIPVQNLSPNYQVLSHIIALHKSRIEIPEALDDDTTAFKWEKVCQIIKNCILFVVTFCVVYLTS